MSLNDSGAMGQSVGPHPDAIRLAEFADNVLEPEQRHQVMEHLADCAECRQLVAATQLLEKEDTASAVPPGSFRSRRRVMAMAAIGLSAAALLILAVRGREERQVESARAEFIALLANEPTRPFAARLVGDDRYRPAAPVRRGGTTSAVSPAVRIAAAELEQRFGTERDPAAAAAVGAASAVIGELDKGIAELERAVAADPREARYRVNLSAVYLARALRDNRSEDVRAALAQAEEAARLDSGLPEACFNRALALEQAGERERAAAAWQACAAREPDRAWADEMRDRSGRLGAR